MAAYLDKERLNTAITESTKFDLSHVHITTGNFMQLQPIYNKEMVPGEKIDVNVETFSRMNTLPVPTFGRANIKNRAYFVPMRTIFRGWNDFITDAPHTDSGYGKSPAIINKVPTVTNNALALAFISSNWDMYGTYTTGLVSGSSSSYDVVVNDGYGVSFKKFSPAGRVGIKVLESLGYKVNWNVYDKTEFSALPLLALAKVYVDWYFPNAYTNNANYNTLLALCNYDLLAAPLTLSYADVATILNMVISVSYDSDYFVSAWDNPTSPGQGKVSNFRIPNLDYYGTELGTSANWSTQFALNSEYPSLVTNNQGAANQASNLFIGGASAPFISPMSAAVNTSNVNVAVPTAISQYLLHSLHALTDYLKRHQLVGSKAMDRYLARYGKALPAEKMNRSVYLGSQMVPVQIGDVMSTADTEGATLGDYSGKGLAYGNNGNFSYQTDEFGIFIIVSSIVPATGYFQGRNRLNTKHIYKLDFWTPEFESIGTQPITADELYVSRDGASNLSAITANDGSFGPGNVTEQVFGFTPRYAEYKIGYDQVTGNMRIPTLNGDASTNNGSAAWHLMRTFQDSDFNDGNGDPSIANMVHSLDFVYSRGDMGRYNRIFNDASTLAADQFTIVHQFNIGDYAPMKPLYDSYDWLDKGKKVTLDVNGVKHN